MITRVISTSDKFNLLNANSKTVNTSGYKSAKIKVKATYTAGNYGSCSAYISDILGNNLKLYGKKCNIDRILVSQYYGSVDEEYLVDLSSVNSIVITTTVTSFFFSSASLEIYYSYDSINVDEFNHTTESIRRIASSNIEKEYGVTGKYCSIDLDLESLSTNAYVIDIKGKIIGSDVYSTVSFYNITDKLNHPEGYVSLISGNTSIWFYSANYSSVKLIVRASYALSPYVNIGVRFTDKLNRTIVLPIDSSRSDFGEFKYAKITFENYNRTIYKHQVSASASNNGVKVLPTLRDLSGKHLVGNQKSDILYDNGDFYFLSIGEKVKGGFILEYPKNTTGVFAFAKYDIVNKIYGGVAINEGRVYLSLYDDECEFTEEKESVISEKNEYRIVNLNIQEAVVDALGEDILTKVSDNLYRYYRMGINGWYYDIPIDVEHIPSLIEGETIRSVKLVKDSQQAINCNYNRICLFTNKNRILYNFIKEYYINYFREAPVYNSQKKWHPVNDKALTSSTAKYLPIFPDYNYNQFSGRISESSPVTDEFGLELPTKVSTFNGYLLEDFRKDNVFSFLADSSFCRSKFYGTIWGMYNLINGDPCLLATANGKEWTIINWFASVEDYDMSQLTTLKVDLSPIITNAGGYTSGSLKVTQRKYSIPNSTNKNPLSKFVMGGSASITNITVANNETVITVADENTLLTDQRTSLQFNTLAPVVFFENVSASAEYDYICNSCDADGNGNNGLFFRLQRIAQNQFKVWGNVGNPYISDPICRHIHSVSEYQGGFLVTTGENYRTRDGVPNIFEGGFIYVVPANNRNNSTGNVYNHKNVKTSYFWQNLVRLTSSEVGVNRACGGILKSNKDRTLILVSDDLTHSRSVSIEGRTNPISLDTHGVLSVNLADIDDYNNVDCIAETYNPAVGLTENNGRLAVSQFAGNAIFSGDGGKTWHQEPLFSREKGLSFGATGGSVNGMLDDGSFFYKNTKIEFK